MANQTPDDDAAARNPEEQTSIVIPAAEGAVATEPTRLERAERIVRNNLYWSLGIGAIPFPMVDVLGLGALQLQTVKQISEVYGVAFAEHKARNVIAVLISTIGRGLLTRLALVSMIKTLPFAGAFIGGVVAMPLIAGASTYAVGQVFIKHFENGGDLLDVDAERLKDYFKSQMEAGKKLASDLLRRNRKKGA